MFVSFSTIIKQLVTRKATNTFPVKYQPYSLGSLKTSETGTDPVSVPERFRGRQIFSFDKCIGCGMCARICPSRAIEMYPVKIGDKNSKRIEIYLARCIFCMECVDVCPKNAIEMSGDFLLSNYSKLAGDQVVGSKDRENYLASIKTETDPAGQP